MNRSMAIGRQEDEDNAALPARELAFTNQLLAVFNGHRAGQIDPWYHQGSSKVAATWRQAAPHILPAGGDAMEKVINCPCGFVLKGGSDEEVVAKAQAHAKQVHQMDLSREQALAMAKPA